MSSRILLSILARTPMPVISFIGYCLGWLFWLVPNKKRRIAHTNLNYCLPELGRLQRYSLLRRSLIHEAQTLLEIPIMMSMPQKRMHSMIREVIGIEYLKQGMKMGCGVILAVPHLGNWEIINLHCSSLYPMTNLYRPQHRTPMLDAYVHEGRQRFGAKLVPTDAAGVRAMYRALENNELIGILPDQNPGRGTGIFAPFFGHPANTMVLLSRLAKRNHATVLFSYTERLRWGRGFRMHFVPVSDGIYSPDAEESARALNTGLEECIRKNPSQYWWSYKRFNITPDGSSSIYH
ncbi:MAG TPA: lipid A biosynthesis acyltransferase [Gammaproteobacteria bacterium]|nr:lipid A biosynthesis acyltransferase [Gammaproteobacteria bacterium]